MPELTTTRRYRPTTTALAGLALLAAGSLAACGGDDDDATSDAPATVADDATADDATADDAAADDATSDTGAATTAAPVEAIEATFPSGATASHPANWTSYGEGFTGSLELAIPQVANVSLRDAAASEYMYGPMLPDQDSLDGAFDMLEFGLGKLPVGERTTIEVDGQEMLMAEVDNNGAAAIAAVMASGDSYASVYAESLDGPLTPDVVDSILTVLASITP